MFGLNRFRATREPAPLKIEELSIHGRDVEISRRAYKRSLGLTLKMNGTIRISAPNGISLARIRDFVAAQKDWIETNLKKYESVRKAYPQKFLCEGEVYPFLGRSLVLKFEPSSGPTKACFKIQGETLVCGIHKSVWHLFDAQSAHPELMPALIMFYKKKAREILITSVETYSQRMELFPTGLSFRAQRTRWGSCSSRGRISLNWKLIIAPIETINYVVVHELSHLKFYDHSPAFWSLVSTQAPDFLVLRTWLKENQFLADFLSPESELHPH